eukprot:GEMP01054118.1.p1 GENE.GEMP01054118.1~~GEMP01054118.1.p1  ORF type:complete len:181 (+),score=17.47 GEMP01054118.1:242-784(+)
MRELQDLRSNTFSDSLRSVTSNFLGQEEDPLVDSLCPDLSYKQRLYGWGACFLLGCFISLLSFGQFFHHLAKFALLYTFGNLVGLCSSFFLSGPRAQLRAMKDPKRIGVTSLFLLSMALTLWSAHWIRQDRNSYRALKRLLVLILVLTQWCCLTWYCLSYIPYGRRMARTCLSKLFFCFF